MKNGEYELVLAPEDYPGKKYRGRYCYEHHLVWWQKRGSLPGPGEVIHHKNENKRDNRISNLEKVARSEHTKHHSKDKTMETLTCAWCGISFERDVRNVRTKRRRGQTRFFCTRSHAVSHQRAYSDVAQR